MLISSEARVYVYDKMIDMRFGFEKLTYYIREEMGFNIDEGDLFLFLGKNRKRLKALYFDGSGLILIAKRLEKKNFMLLSDLEGRQELSKSDFDLIVHGSVVRRYLPMSKVSRQSDNFAASSFVCPV